MSTLKVDRVTGKTNVNTVNIVIGGGKYLPDLFDGGKDVDMWLNLLDCNQGNILELILGGGTTITRHLSGTVVWDPDSVNDGEITSGSVEVNGAVVGDTVAVGFSTAVPAGALLVGAVTEPNLVTVTLFNKTGTPLNLASGTLRADVWQH